MTSSQDADADTDAAEDAWRRREEEEE